jgi:XTP/dITP diphosphohydrolase
LIFRPNEIVLATANSHKVTEILNILETYYAKDLNIDIHPRPSDVGEIEETGNTFLANARIKASRIAQATNLPALADDSGLLVNSLGGLPGVNSSCYAGEHASDEENVEKLLSEMRDFQDRGASFITQALLVFPDGDELSATGEIKGQLLFYSKGQNGFGYDPVFKPDGYETTFAEMSPELKDSISHRKKAFIALFDQILSLEP